MGIPRGDAGPADDAVLRVAEEAAVSYLLKTFPDLAGGLAGRYLRGELGTDRWGRLVDPDADASEPAPADVPGAGSLAASG